MHGALRRFRADARGVTAIEFALISPFFFSLMGATLETSLMFFSSQIFDSAVHDASRLVRTGRAHAAGYDIDAFRNAMCDRLYGMFDCSQVRIKVSVVADFANSDAGDPTDPDDGSWTVVPAYDPGVGGDVIMVEAYYKWPVILELFDFTLKNLPDGTRLFAAVRVFRNEPFS